MCAKAIMLVLSTWKYSSAMKYMVYMCMNISMLLYEEIIEKLLNLSVYLCLNVCQDFCIGFIDMKIFSSGRIGVLHVCEYFCDFT
jgi:hypothetical protein